MRRTDLRAAFAPAWRRCISQLIDSLPKRSLLPIRIAGRFFTGLLLAGISVTSHASGTVPPIPLPSAVTVKYEIYTNGKYDSPTAACASYTQSWTGFTGAWEVERYDANQQFVADPNGDICAIDIYHDGRYGSKVNIVTRYLCPTSYTAVNAAWTCQGNACPDHSTGTPQVNPTVCTCNDGYEPDPTKTKCVPVNLTIKLEGGTTIEPGKSLPFIATVTNQNNNQPPTNPVTVNVSLKVAPTSGGHDHGDGTRPRGGIADVGACPSDSKCWEKQTDGNGAVVFNFNAPEASGTHTITATCEGCTNTATKTVDVKVDGLRPISPSGLYALYEADGSVIGAVQGRHRSNHYLTTIAANRLLVIAINYHHFHPIDPVLHINDASLMWGGVFDIDTEAEWNPPHEEHMRGTVVDIRANSRTGAIPTGNFESFIRLAKLRKVNAKIHSPGQTNQHFHVRLLNRSE